MACKEIEMQQTTLLDNEKFKEVVYKPTTVTGPLKSDQDKNKSGFLFLSAFIVNLLAFSAGVSFSWSSPVIPKLDQPGSDNPLAEPITKAQASWVTGILCFGAGLGPLIAGKLADKIGRKNTLLSIAIPMTLAYIVLGFSSNVNIFYAARLIKGLGVGSSFAVLPMYLGEIAEDSNRGTIGCLMGVFISIGLLFSYIVGPTLTVRMFCFACTLPLITFFFLFYFLVPETPAYLASTGNKNAAQASLMRLRSKKASEVQQELMEIVKSSEESNASKGGMKDLFISKGLRKAFIICTGLLLVQQVAGINIVLAYMQTIFDAAGGVIPSDIATVVIGVIQVFATIGTSSVVDRLGRKLLILGSAIGSCVSLITLGLFFYLNDHKFDVSQLSWLPVASLILYIVVFNFGLGPLPWAIMGEMFPSSVKSAASALISCICFMTSFFITLLFPMLSMHLGNALTFWLFAGLCGLGIIFIVIVMPETKGKTLSEIQDMLSK